MLHVQFMKSKKKLKLYGLDKVISLIFILKAKLIYLPLLLSS